MSSKLYILVLTLLLSLYSNASTIVQLKAGWNLIGINDTVSLNTIKSEVGENNLLNVQGDGKTYQKAYEDAGYSQLNNFEKFEPGKGFWIRVQNSTSLTYTEDVYTGQVSEKIKSGWNLISPLKELSLNEIKTKIGQSNLLNIQGDGRTYQKAYEDAGYSQLNNFEKFELSKGYWIRVANEVNLVYEFEADLDIPAKNVTLNNLEHQISSGVIVKVFSSESISETGQSSNAITGFVDNTELTSELQLNDSYSNTAKFQVKVFDSNGKLLGKSAILDNSNIINFGTIRISSEDNGGDTGGGSDVNSQMTPPNPNDDGSLTNLSIPFPPQIPGI